MREIFFRFLNTLKMREEQNTKLFFWGEQKGKIEVYYTKNA